MVLKNQTLMKVIETSLGRYEINETSSFHLILFIPSLNILGTSAARLNQQRLYALNMEDAITMIVLHEKMIAFLKEKLESIAQVNEI